VDGILELLLGELGEGTTVIATADWTDDCTVIRSTSRMWMIF